MAQLCRVFFYLWVHRTKRRSQQIRLQSLPRVPVSAQTNGHNDNHSNIDFDDDNNEGRERT